MWSYTKLILILLSLALPRASKADYSLGYYYIAGTIKNSRGELLTNKRVMLRQGERVCSFKTDNNGGFKARISFMYPCLSSGGFSRARYDKQDQSDANEINGQEIEFFYDNEITIVPELWKKYYLKGTETADLKNLENLGEIQLKTERTKNISKFLKHVRTEGSFSGRVNDLCEQLSHKRDKEKREDANIFNHEDSSALIEIGENIYFLVALNDITNERFVDLPKILGLTNEWFKPSIVADRQYKLSFPCFGKNWTTYLDIQTNQEGFITYYDLAYCSFVQPVK